MNNPDLVGALCEQIKAEAEALQKTTWNIRSAINDKTRDMLTELQVSHVVHLQNLTLALTEEMTSEELTEYEKQVEESAESGGE